jgi:LysM repeat protein
MRTPRSHIFIPAVAVAVAVLGLSACVPSANDKKTIDTLDPLSVSPVTSTTMLPASDVVIVTAGTVAQPTVSPTATVLSPAVTTNTADAAESPTSAPTANTSGATTTTSASGPGTYTIVAKDSLFGIAKRCSIGPLELANYNDWSDGTAHLIIPGQKIKMPCVPKADSTGATTTTVADSSATTTGDTSGSTPAATSTTVSESAGGTYTVVAGDYLNLIATNTGTTVDAIVKANGWTDGASHPIFPGQVIKMPAKA